MAIEIVSGSATQQTFSQTNPSMSVDVGSGSGRLLVVVEMTRGVDTTVSSITYNSDALTEAVSAIHSTAAPDALRIRLYYLINPDSGSNTLAITHSATSGRIFSVHAVAFTGVADSSALDDTDSAEGNSNSPSVTSTPTVDGEVIVGGVIHEAANALSTGSGETTLFNIDQGAWVTSSSYVIQTDKGAQAIDWSGGSDYWVAVAASFKAASAGPVTLTVQEASHNHSAESFALTQAHTLAVADAGASHSADGDLVLVQNITLAVADASMGHSTDGITLTQAHVLAVADAGMSHSADGGLTLVENKTLVVQESWHNHFTDGPVFSEEDVKLSQLYYRNIPSKRT